MKNVIQKIKDKYGGIIKKVLSFLYFAGTSVVPILVFGYIFLTQGSFFLAVASAYASFIVMDAVCSIIEDSSVVAHDYLIDRKERLKLKKQKKEEELEEKNRKLKEIQDNKKYHTIEINEAKENNNQLRDEVIKNKNKIPRTVYRRLREISDKMDDILDLLKENPQEYESIEPVFKNYYPKFKDMTYKFINIYNISDVEDGYEDEFLAFTNEVDTYLDFAKSHIVTSNRNELEVDMNKLIKQLKAEREEVDK